MSGRIGSFSPEGGAKRIDLAESHGHTFTGELTGDCQRGTPAEKILGIVHLAVFVQGKVVEIQRRDMEHLARPLAVAGGDEGGVGVNKPAFLEKAMDRVSRDRPHPEDRAKGIGPRPEMGDGPQEFKGMALFLQRVIGGGSSFDLDGGGVHFTGLFGFRGQNQFPFDAQRSSHVLMDNLLKVLKRIPFRNDLQISLTAAVVEFDERQRFGFTQGAHPAAYRKRLPGEGFGVGIDRGDFVSFHG